MVPAKLIVFRKTGQQWVLVGFVQMRLLPPWLHMVQNHGWFVRPSMVGSGCILMMVKWAVIINKGNFVLWRSAGLHHHSRWMALDHHFWGERSLTSYSKIVCPRNRVYRTIEIEFEYNYSWMQWFQESSSKLSFFVVLRFNPERPFYYPDSL